MALSAFSNFDHQSLLNLDIRDFLKEVRLLYQSEAKENESFKAYHAHVLRLHNEAILDIAAQEITFHDLRIKLRPYFSDWQLTYALIIKYLMAAGYHSESLSNFTTEKAKERVFFTRYDVHVRDTPGLYGYLDINSLLGVRSDSYIFFDYSRAEQNFKQHFLNIGKFAQDALTEIGFHASPADSGMIWAQFDGDAGAQTRWVQSGAGKEFLEGLSRDTHACDRFVDTCYEVFRKQAESFRAHFPDAITLSAHGGAITNWFGAVGIRRAKEADEGPLYKLWRRLFPDQLLCAFMVRDPSWRFESNHMPYEYRYTPVSDGQRNANAYLEELDVAIGKGKAIEMLLHPATLHDQRGHGGLLERMCERMAIPPGRTTLRMIDADQNSVPNQPSRDLAYVHWLRDTKSGARPPLEIFEIQGEGDWLPVQGAIQLGEMVGPNLVDNMIFSDPIQLDDPKQALLFIFHHDPIPQGGLLKIWLIPCDHQGRKTVEPSRALFRQGERSKILLQSIQGSTHIKVLLQVERLSGWRIGTWAKVEPLEFPTIPWENGIP